MLEITKDSIVVMKGENLNIIGRYCRKFKTSIKAVSMKKCWKGTGNTILTFNDGGIISINFYSFDIMEKYFKKIKYAKQALFLPILRDSGESLLLCNGI